MKRNLARRRLFLLGLLGVFSFGVLCGTSYETLPRARGDILGDIIKGGAVGMLVVKFADQLNQGINTLLRQKDIEIEGMTKVVPIIRVGTQEGTQAGATQVVGPAEQVQKVQAVAELELGLGPLRGRALIPVDTKNPTQSKLKGVSGVGVSANIKVRL